MAAQRAVAPMFARREILYTFWMKVKLACNKSACQLDRTVRGVGTRKFKWVIIRDPRSEMLPPAPSINSANISGFESSLAPRRKQKS
jgi:hypothetical protein